MMVMGHGVMGIRSIDRSFSSIYSTKVVLFSAAAFMQVTRLEQHAKLNGLETAARNNTHNTCNPPTAVYRFHTFAFYFQPFGSLLFSLAFQFFIAEIAFQWRMTGQHATDSCALGCACDSKAAMRDPNHLLRDGGGAGACYN